MLAILATIAPEALAGPLRRGTARMRDDVLPEQQARTTGLRTLAGPGIRWPMRLVVFLATVDRGRAGAIASRLARARHVDRRMVLARSRSICWQSPRRWRKTRSRAAARRGDRRGARLVGRVDRRASKASQRSFAALTAEWSTAGPLRDQRGSSVCMPLAYVSQVLADQVLVGGGTVVLCERFEPGIVLETIERERITHLGLVEPGLVELIDHPDLDRRDLSSLVAITHIGADAPANLRRRLLERAGPILAHPYGASEAGIISVLAPPEYNVSHPELLTTAGRLLPGVELEIELPDGSGALPGSEGSIVVRSGAAADGYAFDPGRSGFQTGQTYQHRRSRTARRQVATCTFAVARPTRARDRWRASVMPLDVANALCDHPEVRVRGQCGARRAAGSARSWKPSPPGFATPWRGSSPSSCATATARRFVPEAVLLLADRIPTTEQGKPDRVAITAAIAARLIDDRLTSLEPAVRYTGHGRERDHVREREAELRPALTGIVAGQQRAAAQAGQATGPPAAPAPRSA